MKTRARKTSPDSAGLWIKQLRDELAEMHLLIRSLHATRATDGILSAEDAAKLSTLEAEYHTKLRHRDTALELYSSLQAHQT